jgi:hypothetical protein
MLAILLADALPPSSIPRDFPLIPVLLGVIGGAVVGLGLILLLMRRRPEKPVRGDHRENLSEYPAPPPVASCQLYYLNEPVRVRMLILAPLGRRELPEDVEGLLDRAVRGLGEVLHQDRPAWRTWPPQLSWKGFLPTFTRYVQLPNHEGEPSQYQLVAGQIRLGGQMVVLGLVLMGDEAFHRETRLLEAHQWVEQMRVDIYG